jgi:hypothetical protein
VEKLKKDLDFKTRGERFTRDTIRQLERDISTLRKGGSVYEIETPVYELSHDMDPDVHYLHSVAKVITYGFECGMKGQRIVECMEFLISEIDRDRQN